MPIPAEPEQGSEQRMSAAGDRDVAAHARDVMALARDQASAARSLAMTRRDARDEHDGARPVTGAQVVVLAGERRRRAVHARARGAEYRSLADADYKAAAIDRADAARDRLLALADREAFARLLATMETDPLTGARTRLAGLTDLDHELDRCRRTGGLLVVAYVDIVGLKAVNDSQGHGAGDELLSRVVALIGKRLRSYDLIVRLGGDEFLCAMPNMTLTDARQRFSVIAAELACAPDPAAIRYGMASLTAGESAAKLIARADKELTHGTRDS